MAETHTHTLTVRHRVMGHTDSVEVGHHRVPVLVDMPHRGFAVAEHRKGLAEVERHMGFVAEDHMDFVIAEVGVASGLLA